MKFTFNKLTLLPLAALLLTACGSSKIVNGVDESAPGSSLIEDEIIEVITKYDGAYQSFCGVSAYAPLSDTAVTVTTIDGDKGSITTYNYLDKGCALPADPTQTVMEVSIAYPGETIETNRGVADFVDFTIESIKLDGQAPSLFQQQQLASTAYLRNRFDIIVLQDSALYTGESTETLTGASTEKRPVTLSSHPSIAQ